MENYTVHSLDPERFKGTLLESFYESQQWPFRDLAYFIPIPRTRLERCFDQLDLLQLRIYEKIDVWTITGHYAPYQQNIVAGPIMGWTQEHPDYKTFTYMNHKGVEIARPPRFIQPDTLTP